MPREPRLDITEMLSRDEHIEGVICYEGISKGSAGATSQTKLIAVVDFPTDSRWAILHDEKNSQDWVVLYMGYDEFEYHLEHYGDVWFYEMLVDGYLLFDKAGRLRRSLDKSNSWRDEYLKLKMMADFSILLKKYYMSQYYYKAHQLLDAYHQLLDSVIYWARMVIYDNGQVPKDNVLDQVYNIDIGIYKLYEELTTTREPLIKQIELMQLVYLHQVLSKTRYYVDPLLRIFEKADKPLAFSDIKKRLRFSNASIELHILLDEMVKKNYIRRILKRVNGIVVLYEETYELNQ